MSESKTSGWLAIDVGSSRAKFGWFPSVTACTSETKPSQLPIAAPKLREPEESLALSHVEASPEQFAVELNLWLEQLQLDTARVILASVHSQAAQMVERVLADRFAFKQLSNTDLPVKALVDHPAKVGIDRLLNAVAVNQLREPSRPALVVDLGTANTVDLVTADGDFVGGTILPGIAMSAKVLHESTSSLPLLSPHTFELPVKVVGTSTQEAIVSGLYWGAVGAVSELMSRMSANLKSQPQLFVTGGDARLMAANLEIAGEQAKYVPHMVLAGILITAEELS